MKCLFSTVLIIIASKYIVYKENGMVLQYLLPNKNNEKHIYFASFYTHTESCYWKMSYCYAFDHFTSNKIKTHCDHVMVIKEYIGHFETIRDCYLIIKLIVPYKIH